MHQSADKFTVGLIQMSCALDPNENLEAREHRVVVIFPCDRAT